MKEHHRDKPESDCRKIVKAWLKSELLFADKYDDPVNRKERMGLFVDNGKRPS